MVCSSVTRLQHVIIITQKNAVYILKDLVRYYVYLRDFLPTNSGTSHNVRKILPVDPFLSPMNPVYTLSSCSFSLSTVVYFRIP